MATAKELEDRQGGGGLGCWAAPGPLTCAACLSCDPPGCHHVRRPQACRAASAGRGAESLGDLLACDPRDSHTRTHTVQTHTGFAQTHTLNPRKGSRTKRVNLFIILEQERSFRKEASPRSHKAKTCCQMDKNNHIEIKEICV